MLAAAFAVLTLAYMFSTPPGGSPDEDNHYVRALGAGRGELVLTKSPPPLTPDPSIDPRIRWLHLQSRIVSIPARLSPQPFSCWAVPFYVGDCERSAPRSSRLVEVGTYVGRYPPFSYVVPGILMRLGDDSEGALMWGRAGVALTSLALLVIAVAALRDPADALSLIGIVAAVTPMVIFLMASLSSNGVEIAAGVAFFACLLRLTRPVPSRAWIWGAAAVSGVVLAVVRDLGPFWILAGAAVALTAGSARGAFRLSRAGAMAAVAAIGSAMIVGVAWQLTQASHPGVGPFLLGSLGSNAGELTNMYRQAVGVFGPLDAPMPALAYWIAGLTIGGMAVLALVVGKAREGFAVGGAIAATIGLSLAMNAYQALSGFSAQARHVLPLAVTVPMLSGEIVYRHSGALPAPLKRLLPAAVAAAAAAVHAFGWFTVARRFSVGNHGPLLFFRSPAWAPGFGWLKWAAVVAAAAMLVVSWGALQAFAHDPGKAVRSASGGKAVVR